MNQPLASEQLYLLLPAIYRLRDEQQGGQLRALLAIIEAELGLIRDDIDNLYDNWFIETCDEWVVPYIGELLGVQDLNAESPRAYGQERRAYVANTLTYRQRKGTTSVLEQLARDITGWYARAVEPIPLLAATQNLDHIRPNTVTADIRANRQPERLGTPFEQRVAYTTELRSRPRGRGRYNLTAIALYLWRLQSYPIERGTARWVNRPDAQSQGLFYTFNPLGDGRSLPLFNQPQTETEITGLAEEINVPGPLYRATLESALKAYLQDQDTGKLNQGYLGVNPVFQVFIRNKQGWISVPPEVMAIANLEEWKLPANLPANTQVVVDPEQGRLAFPSPPPGRQVEVSYAYGFSGDVGGGSYNRTDAAADQVRSRRQDPTTQIWDIRNAAHPSQAIADAFDQWNERAQSAQNCYDQTFIPLVRLAINDQGNVRVLNQSLDAEETPLEADIRPQFGSGIVKALTVKAPVGASQAIVLPGVAIDQEGNLIRLRFRYRVNLSCYRNQAVLILISYQDQRWLPRWHIQSIPETTADQFPASHYIRLARCLVDAKGRLAQLDITVRQPFAPGIIRGLQLELPAALTGTVSPGMAINRQGNLMVLEENDSDSRTYVLSRHRPLTKAAEAIVILYLAPPPVPNLSQSEPPKLGTVQDVETGIVYLQDNRTYVGEWFVKIPAGKRFWLLAANGKRPCLYGNLTVQTLALKQQDFSECLLEGLLLKGGVTILPGRLQRLKLAHCTLVPDVGGLQVTKEEPPIAINLDDPFSLLALVFYSLAVIQQLIILGFNTTLPPQQRLTRLFRFARQQTATLFQWVQHTWQACLQPPPQPLPDDTGDAPIDFSIPPDPTGNLLQQNNQLSVEIERSICGTIALADTIPTLTIRDSVIDAAPQADQLNSGAIAAMGTAVTVQSSTVFGTTFVRSLEANDSIFTGKVSTLRRQVGCLRFCAVPEDSQTPRRYRCQPDLRLTEANHTPPSPITALTRHPRLQAVFAATSGTGVFRFIEQTQSWIAINNALSDLNITALVALEQTLVAGTTGGDLWVAPLIRSGLGTITSQGTTVSGQSTFFRQNLSVGDSLIAADQIRLITAIASDTELILDQPFPSDLSSPTPFQNNHIRWIAMSAPGNTRITTLISHPQNSAIALAGTAGNGIFQVTDQTHQDRGWKALNQGLTNQDVRAIAIHPTTGDLYAGTQGGVFRSTDNGETWKATLAPARDRSTSQPNPTRITSLTLNPNNGHLFAGTTTQGIFRSTDNGQHWTPVNHRLPTLNITALVCYSRPCTGTLSSQETQVTGNQTQFTTQLAVKDAIVANGQTRLITAISAADRTAQTTTAQTTTAQTTTPQTLTVNQPFEPELPPDTPFTAITLLAGTAGGTVFRSMDEGETWTKVSTGLTQTDITALLAWINPTPAPRNIDPIYRTAFTTPGATNVLAGTQLGSLYRAVDASDLPSDRQNQRWISINTGLNQVDEMLLILNQMQPRFTSTTYGDPGYAQLTPNCPIEIRTGAEDGSEMGVFHFLKQPQQEANLQASLKEYLRFGLQADLIHIT
jgi:hypothetical protein